MHQINLGTAYFSGSTGEVIDYGFIPSDGTTRNTGILNINLDLASYPTTDSIEVHAVEAGRVSVDALTINI